MSSLVLDLAISTSFPQMPTATGCLLSERSTEPRQRERRQQFRMALHRQTGRFLADGRPELETMAARSRHKDDSLYARHLIDDRQIVRAHVIHAGVTRANAELSHSRRPRHHLRDDPGRLLRPNRRIVLARDL